MGSVIDGIHKLILVRYAMRDKSVCVNIASLLTSGCSIGIQVGSVGSLQRPDQQQHGDADRDDDDFQRQPKLPIITKAKTARP